MFSFNRFFVTNSLNSAEAPYIDKQETNRLILFSYINVVYIFASSQDGKLLTASSRIQLDDANGVGIVYFRPLIKSDEGRYRCEAVNTVGQDFASGELLVLGE